MRLSQTDDATKIMRINASLGLLILGLTLPACKSASGPIAPAPRSEPDHDPSAVMAQAELLVRSGDYENALLGYSWCVNQGLRVRSFEGAWAVRLPRAIRDLGSVYPPALASLRRYRDAAEAAVLVHTPPPEALRRRADWENLERQTSYAWFAATSNEALAEPHRTLAVYDQLKRRGSGTFELRYALWHDVLPHLFEDGRFAYIGQERKVMEHYLNRLRAGALEQHELAESLRPRYVDMASRYFEVLLTLEEEVAAMRLAEDVIEVSQTGDTFAFLIRHARRAGAARVASALRERAYEVVSEAEREIVDGAFSGR